VIFVHGWPDYSLSWTKQLEALSGAGFRTIAVDLRGFGETEFKSGRDEDYSLKYSCEDLKALLSCLMLPSAVFIGHDWGGVIAWQMARRYPTLVRAVCVMCTPFRPRRSEYMGLKDMVKNVMPIWYYQYFFSEFRERAARELEKDVSFSVRAIFRRHHENLTMMDERSAGFLAHAPSGLEPSSLLSKEEFEQYVATFRRTGFHDNLRYYSKLNHYQNWLDESEIGQVVPQVALMITAGKDHVLPEILTHDMEKWVPQLHRLHVEDAAHWVQHECPEIVNDGILNWLVKHVGARPRKAGKTKAEFSAPTCAHPMRAKL